MLPVFVEIYYWIVIATTAVMVSGFCAARFDHFDSTSLEQDATGAMETIKTWGVQLFIPLYVFNMFVYVVPSLFLNFSILSIGFLLAPVILRKRIIAAWKDDGPIHEFFERIEGKSYWPDILFVCSGPLMFVQCLWDYVVVTGRL